MPMGMPFCWLFLAMAAGKALIACEAVEEVSVP